MTQPPGLQPSQVPPQARDGVQPRGQHPSAPQSPHRRRLSWPRRHKRLTAGIAAFGLLLVIGAIGSVKTALWVADHGTRSTLAGPQASAKASIKAGAQAGAKASATATATASAKPAATATANASPKPGATAGAKPAAAAGAKPGATATAKASAKAGITAGAKPSASSSTAAKPEASQDCLAQARAWLNGGSTQQLAALEDGFGALDAAGHAFVAAAAAGAAPAGDITAVQTAAGAVRSDAEAIEANPGPACVPGLRPNLMSGAADYSQVATDATSAMDQYEAGQVSAAVADVEAARPLIAQGSAMISAASRAAGNLSG